MFSTSAPSTEPSEGHHRAITTTSAKHTHTHTHPRGRADHTWNRKIWCICVAVSMVRRYSSHHSMEAYHSHWGIENLTIVTLPRTQVWVCAMLGCLLSAAYVCLCVYALCVSLNNFLVADHRPQAKQNKSCRSGNRSHQSGGNKPSSTRINTDGRGDKTERRRRRRKKHSMLLNERENVYGGAHSRTEWVKLPKCEKRAKLKTDSVDENRN